MARTMLSGSTTPGWPTCRWPMASSWLVSAAARWPARWIASTSVTSGSPGSIRRRRISLHPRMTVRRLLKSCATPPARRAMAPSRSACWNCSSMRWRSVTSSATARIPVTDPSWSRSGAVDTDSWSSSSSRWAASCTPTVASPCLVRSHRRPSAEAAASSAAGMRCAPTARTGPPEQRSGRAVPPPGHAVEVELGDGQRRGLHDGLQPLLVPLHRLVEAGVVEGHRGHLGQEDEDRLVLGIERARPAEHDDGPVARPGGVDQRDRHPRHGPGPRRRQLGGDVGIVDLSGARRHCAAAGWPWRRAGRRRGRPARERRAVPAAHSPPPRPSPPPPSPRARSTGGR